MSAEKPGTEDSGRLPSRGGESSSLEAEQATSVSDLERRDGEMPDLLLDVPQLNIDEIELEVENLQARVALNAEVADFVKINVGVTVDLDQVKLSVKGLEARAVLEVKMERVLDTLNRALEALGSNPQFMDGSARRTAENASDRKSHTLNATEAAGRRAHELGLDLSEVKGTGSGGRILVKDVVRANKEGS